VSNQLGSWVCDCDDMESVGDMNSGEDLVPVGRESREVLRECAGMWLRAAMPLERCVYCHEI